MSKQLECNLECLQNKLITMADIAETMVRDSLNAITKWDIKLFKPVEEAEEKMDMFQKEIDDDIVRMISVYTPVAGDLRFLLMATRITVELERIGDKTIDIGFYAKTLFKEPPMKTLVHLPDMAEKTIAMLKQAMNAYAEKDTAKAITVIKTDDEVDQLHDQIFKELITYVMADPSSISRIMELVLIARAFKRVGDHAVNIAEDVFYIIKGKDIRHIHNFDNLEL